MSGIPPGALTPELSDADFKRVCRLIHKRAGLVLAEHKREMVYNRLVRRLRHCGEAGFTSYLNGLENEAANPEWQNFVNALTTNLTAFFRESYHFPILAEHARSRQGEYRVWSAAASSGEEPWSVAMTLCDELGDMPGRWQVFASDIDSEMLAKAQSGIYRESALEVVTPQQRQRYFQRGTGPQAGWVRVHQRLRGRVEFAQINLLADSYPLTGQFDAIFCRNVMIYFDKSTQKAILQRLAALLRPDGLLFAGHAENFNHADSAFQLRGQTVYQLRPEAR
ncbi:chemotaxis protein methyltransferase [Salmonella enterica subsp. enterica serovar Choleraesuis]|nr:chemotaxis protein methyltransferase [Salmonella enterica subsp. enterica serovar Choleraesuis]